LTYLAALIAFSIGALLPYNADAQGPRIGYVNAVKLIETAPQGEAALKTLEAEFGPREQELRSMRDEIRKLEDEIGKDGLVMKESERREKESAIRELQRTLKRSRDEMREDYNVRRNESLADLQRVVTKAIVEIAKQEEYDLILQDSVYVSPTLDITEQVLEKLRNIAKQ
jgi:outer membrane protein